jgi:hypothetical protein
MKSRFISTNKLKENPMKIALIYRRRARGTESAKQGVQWTVVSVLDAVAADGVLLGAGRWQVDAMRASRCRG